MKEPKFKVGDVVTALPRRSCVSKDGTTGRYYWEGNDCGGVKGEVTRNDIEFIERKDCYRINVVFDNGNDYSMLECEMEEYLTDMPDRPSIDILPDAWKRLPKYWYSDKTRETMDALLKAFRGHENFETTEYEFKEYRRNSNYPNLGVSVNEYASDDEGELIEPLELKRVEINQEDYFSDREDCQYLSPEELLSILTSTSPVYATSSKSFVESNFSQITQKRKEIKSFFKF